MRGECGNIERGVVEFDEEDDDDDDDDEEEGEGEGSFWLV